MIESRWDSFRRPALMVLITLLCIRGATAATPETESDPRPRTALELYNAGTARLREKKLEEAQDLLRSAAQANDESVLPSAVYNLGHARYEIGDRELIKTLMSPDLNEVPKRANRSAEAALRSAQSALAGGDVDELVQAYRRGAGARRELREAAKAVQAALAQFQKVLMNWERASASFHSVSELDPADTNATYNADLVDRRIAELIDFLKQQKMAMMSRGNTGQQLKGAMKQLRDRIPADKRGQLPGGAEDEDEEGEGEQQGNNEGGDDPNGRKGKAPLTQEQAAQLLRGAQLDSNRTLPPNSDPRLAKPVKRQGGDW
jgi:tetratricopeptide (TPR) repeat protein